MQVPERIKELIDSIAKERGYYIVDTTYKREGGKLMLRIFPDKPNGITMDECTRFNKELSELLDKESVIEDQYTLEVSSPGLDRKLEKDTDFVWAVGKQIRVTTYASLNGKNTFSGTLLGLGEERVVVDENGVSTEIPREKIASAKLALDIDWSKT